MRKWILILICMLSFNAKAETIYYYDDNGRLIRSEYDTSSSHDYYYDENGYLIRRDHTPVNLTFNEQGQIVERRYGTSDEYYIYTYNDNGRIDTSTYYSDGNFSYRREYSYDENGKQTGYTQYNAAGNVTGTYTYQFDEYGNITGAYKNGVLQYSNHYTDNYLAKQKAAQRPKKRIYTVDEATKLSKPTGNTFKIRYK